MEFQAYPIEYPEQSLVACPLFEEIIPKTYLSRNRECLDPLRWLGDNNHASIAEDKVEVQSLENSFAINVSPVVPPGT